MPAPWMDLTGVTRSEKCRLKRHQPCDPTCSTVLNDSTVEVESRLVAEVGTLPRRKVGVAMRVAEGGI